MAIIFSLNFLEVDFINTSIYTTKRAVQQFETHFPGNKFQAIRNCSRPIPYQKAKIKQSEKRLKMYLINVQFNARTNN